MVNDIDPYLQMNVHMTICPMTPDSDPACDARHHGGRYDVYRGARNYDRITVFGNTVATSGGRYDDRRYQSTTKGLARIVAQSERSL